jgi:hypothetical protein
MEESNLILLEQIKNTFIILLDDRILAPQHLPKI